ncbi:MAG: DUF3224 domain-containing protein [Deltaproteobacteria bacterium]|nr:DUF3224 domain-containing protein [Deltaproteobacteria bacterium]
MTQNTARGTFTITHHAEPPYDTQDGVTLARTRFEKVFSGPLDATSTVHMLSALTGTKGSAGYVALERIEGSLDGRKGSFVCQHNGVMDRGHASLWLTVVPDSAAGELAGLRGRMHIEITQGVHHYVLEYQFVPAVTA